MTVPRGCSVVSARKATKLVARWLGIVLSLPLGTLVTDQRTVTPRTVRGRCTQAQAAGAAFRGEERLEQVALHAAGSSGWPSLHTRRLSGATGNGGPGCDTDGARNPACVAQRVVQQVDQHAAQVVGFEHHFAALRRADPGSVSRRMPTGATSRCRPGALHRPAGRPLATGAHRRAGPAKNAEHLIDTCARRWAFWRTISVSFSGPARTGLHRAGRWPSDGGQRVADLVRHSRRHAAHGCELRCAAALPSRAGPRGNITHRLSLPASCVAVRRVRTWMRRGAWVASINPDIGHLRGAQQKRLAARSASGCHTASAVSAKGRAGPGWRW